MVNKPSKEINRITKSIQLMQMKVEKREEGKEDRYNRANNNIMCLNLTVPFPLNILDLNTPIKRQKFRMG